MIYGLYLSATGIMANSYKQDVLANNLANSETVGFKRDLAYFQERRTAAQEQHRPGNWSDPLLEHLGGGLLASATKIDHQQGDLEQTGNPLDMGIEGNGYFAVTSNGQTRLTRDGRMMTNTNNELVLADGRNHVVLDTNQNPIKLEAGGNFDVAKDGTVRQNGNPVARIGLFDVADPSQLKKMGETLMAYPDGTPLQAADGAIHGQFLERANVDPTTELSALMDTQRQLEANANMIRYQDATLQRLVNDVGKIG